MENYKLEFLNSGFASRTTAEYHDEMNEPWFRRFALRRDIMHKHVDYFFTHRFRQRLLKLKPFGLGLHDAFL